MDFDKDAEKKRERAALPPKTDPPQDGSSAVSENKNVRHFARK